MKTHEIEQLAQRRGDPKRIDRARGLKSGGKVSERYVREVAAMDNLATGQCSPAAREYLRVTASVNPEIPANWIGAVEADVVLRAAMRAGVAPERARDLFALNLTNAFSLALQALLNPRSTAREVEIAARKLLIQTVRVLYGVTNNLPPVGAE